MKILFLVQTLNHGGMERQLIQLTKGLQGQGHSPIVLHFHPNGPFEKNFTTAGVPVLGLNKQGRWDVFRFLWNLATTVRKENPDIVYSFLAVPNILTSCVKPLVPSSRIVWGIRASNMNLKYYDRLVGWSYWTERRLAKFPDLIISNSHAGYAHARSKGFPTSKMVVIPNGIDTSQFCPNPIAGIQIRSEWGIGDDEILVGTVGRFDPMKDHATFLRAASMFLREENKSVRFVCVGDGAEERKNSLLEIARKLGLASHLRIAGPYQDMSAMYNAFDLFCLPSSFGEGFSNVLGEAMACGVPCVVTDVGDSRAIVGDTGLIVPPCDPRALCAAWVEMENLGIDGRRNLGAKARERILTHYDLGRLISRTSQALESVVAGH